MTLIVGILATNGVVIAADRAVTFGSTLGPTVTDLHKKIDVIQANVIVAGTGQAGLAQRFRWVASKTWSDKQFTPDPVPTMTLLAGLARNDFSTTGVQKGSFGGLVAYALGNKPQLIEFDVTDFQPEAKTEGCWYASMGSGQSIADPYLALMRRSVWKEGQPDIKDATFAAYWVMKQAIDAAPGFISEPIDIAVLRRWRERGDYESRFLTDDDLAEHAERAELANEQLSDALMGRGAKAPEAEVAKMPQP